MAGAHFSHAELSELRVVDLREILSSLKLPVSGIKDDLIDRILAYQSRMKTQAMLIELEISKLELSTRELEFSRFRTGHVNHASSSLNLAANSNGILPSRIHGDAPEQIPQGPADPIVHARARISPNALETVLQQVQNQANQTTANISVQDQPYSDSVHTPVENSQGQQRPSSATHVNDNSAHVIFNDGSDHSNAAAKQQRQLGQNIEYNQSSSIFGANDMLLTMPYSSQPIHVHVQANEPQAVHQTIQKSFVGSQPKCNDSEWLVTKPTMPQPVTQLGAPNQNNAWLSQSHNSNRSATSVHTHDNNAWLCKTKARSTVNTKPVSGWHISALPPEPNSMFTKPETLSDEPNPWILSSRSNSANQPSSLELPAQSESNVPVTQPVVLSRSEITPVSHNSQTSCCNHSESDSYRDLIRAQEHRELVEAIKAPAVKPPIFSGELIDYPRWKKAFTAFLNQRVLPSASDKLYYLDQYTSGQVTSVIQSYIYLDSEQAFQDAMADIEKLYGNSFLVAQAFKAKLSSWSKISSTDAMGIFNFTNFLKHCLTAMNDICDLQCLNLSEKNQEMVNLLPDFMARNWNSKVTEYQLKNKNSFPPFSVFVEFMQLESAKANNPVTSQNALKQASKSKQSVSNNQPVKPKTNPNQGSKQAYSHDTTAATAAQKPTEKRRNCPYCDSSDHYYTSKCQKFRALSIDERWKAVQANKMCHRCLGVKHQQNICKRDWKCGKCQKQTHHTLLHRDSGAPASNNAQASANTVCNATQHHSDFSIFSPSIPVWVSSAENPQDEILTYAMIDGQSNKTFITNELSSMLDAKPLSGDLEISTMTSVNEKIACDVFPSLRVRGFHSSVYFELPFTYGRNHIPCNVNDIPTSENIRDLVHLESIRDYIAPKLDCGAGLLLGRDCTRAITIKEILEPPDGEAQAIKYALGWTVIGPSQKDCTHLFSDQVGVSHVTFSVSPNLSNPVSCIPARTSICFKTQVKDVTPRELMKQIDGVEFQDVQSDQTMSQDDLKFLDIMNNKTYQNDQNFYVMPLPFKKGENQLECNYEPVLKRFHGLLSQFRKRGQEFKTKYSDFMNGFISRGEAELVPKADLESGEGSSWYLPHHGVIHRKTNKLRCVFDCSSEYKGLSLNDALLQGPDLNNSLLGVLMRFREKPVAVCCDIEKMYHRFYVTPEFRDYMRFFWLDSNDEIQTYRMCVHIFGARSSPSCAKYGLNRIAQEHGSSYPLAQKFIQRNFYVDDGLCSVDNIDQAIQLLNDTKSICSKGNLRVHKLLSNQTEVLEAFPQEDVNLDLTQDVQLLNTERALGMLWSLSSDSFRYNYVPNGKPCTRKNILSNVASVYDPMGLVSPLLLSGRNLIQQTCKSGLDWDEVLSGVIADKWKLWDAEMTKISKISIPRCMYATGFVPVKCEIHTFADASQTGYGACSYVRAINSNQDVHCSLLHGKSRVAPIKPTTIPRLELQAALLAAKQSRSVLSELEWNCDAYLWSDSKIVLGYINNDAKRFHTFVANRLSQIHDISDLSQWHYVRTDRNPADIASRGVNCVSDFMNSDWFQGPKFLWETCDIVDSASIKFELDPNDPEIKQSATVLSTDSNTLFFLEQLAVKITNKSSTWTKTQCNVAAVLKIKSCHSFLGSGKLSSDDYQSAAKLIIKAAQKSYFSKEIQLLKSGQLVDKTSSLWRLDCFLDNDSLLRVGGRMKLSAMLDVDKHPIILPKSSHLSKQIIRYYHDVAHQGRTATMSAVRSAGYWIVGLSSLVSTIIHQCVTCRRLRRPTEVQKMADLPADRVEVTPPFTNVGCDVFGPFPVKEGRKCMKRYGLLFTCMSSRAVHIEILDDLSTDCFLQSWRCFLSLRGNVKLLRCDNGTNFVGANNEISKLFSEMNQSDSFTKFLREHQCQFLFNTPQASHMGGSWERLIRSVRAVFSGLTIHMHNLTTSNLRTIMYECMAIINSRPLTSISPDCKPLSPNDLLHLKSSVILPMPGSYSDSDIYARKRWRAVQLLVDRFWQRWKKEYVHQMQIRQKWNATKRNLSTNDVVILHDECNRTGWKLGRVVETIPSSDGLVRSVKVLTIDSGGTRREYTRPVSKLVCILESDDNV